MERKYQEKVNIDGTMIKKETVLEQLENFKKFRQAELTQIKMGLEAGIDVYVYAKPEYVWSQMEEIRIGLEKNLDVTIYANSKFNWLQMQKIRLGLEEGLDVTSYAKPKYNHIQMGKMLAELKKKKMTR